MQELKRTYLRFVIGKDVEAAASRRGRGGASAVVVVGVAVVFESPVVIRHLKPRPPSPPINSLATNSPERSLDEAVAVLFY